MFSFLKTGFSFAKGGKEGKRGSQEGMILVKGGRTLFDQAVYTPSPSSPLRRSFRRVWTPRGLDREMSAYLLSHPWQPTFTYTGHNRGEFYRWLRESIPMVGAGVWTWVRLCATRLTQIVDAPAARLPEARQVLADLDSRILEAPYGRGSGLTQLCEGYFLELFTNGRFAGELILTPDQKGIDHFHYLDPFSVGWEHTPEGWVPFVIKLTPESPEPIQERLHPHTFFYGTLGVDLANPLGNEPLASIPFIAEIEQLMLEDMARSSHNAGTPRLQVKVNRPERLSWEGDKEYTERANRYFQDLVGQFSTLEPDDNIFTWSDVEITVVGGSGKSWEWRFNREQVIEDVITGLRLYPWVLGRTHKTTQNWVRSQYDLLMQVVQNYQRAGLNLVDWIAQTELTLKGIPAQVHHQLERHPDPFRLEKAQAMKLELERIDRLVEKGYITREEARQMLGLKPFADQL